MHTLSLVIIHWDLFKLLSWNEYKDVSRQITVKKQSLPTSNLKENLHNISAISKFREN